MRQEYEDVVESIYRRRTFRGKISLEPMADLVAALGNPEQEFPVVHVAGTNGKGSTATMLAEILQREGLTTGLFTSPHLVDFRERIRVGGKEISREDVIAVHGRISDTSVDASFFECMTGMAFDHFSCEDVDIAVVETGMGGRVDATNVVDSELSVITNVAEEHTKWLGETPEQIAYELAGIITDGAPVVSGATGRPAEVIASVAREEGSELVPVEDHVKRVERSGMELALELDEAVIDTGMLGGYQLDNINTVLSACRTMERDIAPDSIRSALEEVWMPGRMEVAVREPLVLLDGAHNPDAVNRMEEAVRGIGTGKTVAVVSIMADKDYPEMLSTIEAFADLVILSEAGIDRAEDPEELASCLDSVDHEVVRCIPDALDTALGSIPDDGTVLVTGSMYFVGDVKKELAERQTVL